jgi:sulfotransferase
MSFVCLSGLPRSGSTLLSSILSQNPEIYAEGLSSVCQLMWEMEQTFETELCKKNLLSANKLNVKDRMIRSIPKIYYEGVQAKHIVDKSRAWTFPSNVEMIKRYIRKDPKIIVMVRPLEEIFLSFANLKKRLGLDEDISQFLVPGSEPILWPLEGLVLAQQSGKEEYFFVEYDDLVQNTKEVIEGIYNFCEWEPFEHWYSNIKNPYPPNDDIWELPGLHDVRSTISKRIY